MKEDETNAMEIVYAGHCRCGYAASGRIGAWAMDWDTQPRSRMPLRRAYDLGDSVRHRAAPVRRTYRYLTLPLDV